MGRSLQEGADELELVTAIVEVRELCDNVVCDTGVVQGACAWEDEASFGETAGNQSRVQHLQLSIRPCDGSMDMESFEVLFIMWIRRV